MGKLLAFLSSINSEQTHALLNNNNSKQKKMKTALIA